MYGYGAVAMFVSRWVELIKTAHLVSEAFVRNDANAKDLVLSDMIYHCAHPVPVSTVLYEEVLDAKLRTEQRCLVLRLEPHPSLLRPCVVY
jgi:hypothetical protein